MKTNKSLLAITMASMLFVGSGVLFIGCTTQSSKQSIDYPYDVFRPHVLATVPNYSTPPLVINVHQHYTPTEEWEKQFIDTYSKYNAIACCFITGVENLEHGMKFAKAHPDRVIPFWRGGLDDPTVLEDIKRAYSLGIRGFGEVLPGSKYPYDDPHYEPIWTLLEELGMVPLLHTGVRQTGIFDMLRPATLATIAASHPKLNIIGAHFGNPWYDEAAEGSRRNPNLYWDITGSSLIKKENDPGIWEQYLWWTDIVGTGIAHTPRNVKPAFEYLVFGTDQGPDEASLRENIRRFNKMLDANNVADSTRAKMWGLTVARILGIELPLAK